MSNESILQRAFRLAREKKANDEAQLKAVTEKVANEQTVLVKNVEQSKD